MTVLKNHWGRRVVVAAIVAIAAALTVAPSGQKLQAAGMVFVVLFVVLALFKGGGGTKEDAAQPAAVRGSGERRREAEADDGDEEQQRAAPTGRRRVTGVRAEAVMELGPMRQEDLMRLVYDPPDGDEVWRRAAGMALFRRLQEDAGARLPVPRMLLPEQPSSLIGSTPTSKELTDTRGQAKSLLGWVVDKILRR